MGLAVDQAGNVYVADLGNNSIRQLTPNGDGSYAVTTIAGLPNRACSTVDGPPAGFCAPIGITVTGLGELYVTESDGAVLRKLTYDATQKNWSAATLAGSPGVHGVQVGAPAATTLNRPSGIALSPAGDPYVTDGNENALLLMRVR
jgi:hypothetical protein